MNETGNKIKSLRIALGMSQEDLAKKTGYTDRSSIAKIEQGKVNLYQDKIELFAKVLHVTPMYLMGWDESAAPYGGIPSLRPDESALLAKYNLMNDSGKLKVQEYVSDLSENKNYTIKEKGQEGPAQGSCSA